MKAAEAAKTEAAKRMKTVTDTAAPKDIVDIVVSRANPHSREARGSKVNREAGALAGPPSKNSRVNGEAGLAAPSPR